MANDDRPRRKVKDDVNTKSKKKDASPASVSGSADAYALRRSGRETSSTKQTASPSNTRKSERIEKRTPPNTPPVKKRREINEKQIGTSPLRRSDRGRKDLSEGSSGSKKFVEVPASSNMRSKNKKVSEDISNDRLDPDSSNIKRKRMTARHYKSLFKPQRLRIEADDDKDPERQDKSPQADTISNRGVDKSNGNGNADKQIVGKCSSSKRKISTGNMEGYCCANNEDNHISDTSPSGCKKHDYDETCLSCSKKQRINDDLENWQELNSFDKTSNKDLYGTSSSKVREACKATGVMENEENNDVTTLLRKETSSDTDRDSNGNICVSCKLGGQVRCCPVCAKNVKLSGPSVSRIAESIWDTREVEVLDAEGLQNQMQKQYFVQYKGLAHIHNQWVTEAQLLIEAPLLVEIFSQKHSLMKWNKSWTVPHELLKKRLLLSFKPLNENQENPGKVLNYHYEWLVKWQGLDNRQATWELENASVLDSPTGQNLIKEYENNHGKTKISASQVDKTKELQVKLPPIPCCPIGMEHIHLNYVKKLHDSWTEGQSRVVFDYQERVMRVVLFLLSLKGVTRPFLIIATSDSLSQWEDTFLRVAPSNDFIVSIEDREAQSSVRLLEVQKEGDRLAFQVLLYPVDAFVKDLHLLKNITWEATIVDESQCYEISAHFNHIKSLSTDNRLLLFSGPLGESMVEYLNVLSLLGCDAALSNNRSQTELDDSYRKLLKETLSRYIAYQCKFVEFWVPVQISNVQLEQYCNTLLSKAMVLSSGSKKDTVGALNDIIHSNQKCCDHPYIVDSSLRGLITKDLEQTMRWDVEIKASGKLQFLDLMLPEVKKRQLRVLILFQPTGGSPSLGDILDDFVVQKFGLDSYERVDGGGKIVPSKKQAALNNFNNDTSKFIFLLESRGRLPIVKLSSVDIIVIFDSDLNPSNDLRALQKISIDSQSEQIMIFRLYSSCTLEEKILRLAEHNMPVDTRSQYLNRSTCDALLMWGASYLFNKLSEFHSASNRTISSEESFFDEVMDEFVYLISHKCKSKDTAKPIITRVNQSCGTYVKSLPLHNEMETQLPDGEHAHVSWRKLLEGRDPMWKFVSVSTPRQRKRPQYFEDPSIETFANDADVGKKRKKTVNNTTEPASKPVIEGETGEANEDLVKGEWPFRFFFPTWPSGVPAQNGSQLSPNDPFWSPVVNNEMSLHDLLKHTLSKLYKLFKFTEDVKITVDRFLEYVLENFHVSKEPTSTLQALMISLCCIGSSLSNDKIDRTKSFALAKKHLNFSCTEQETNSVCSKLELAKEQFLRHTENQNKPPASKDDMPAPQATSTQSVDSQGVELENVDENHELSNEETLQNNKHMPDKCNNQKEIEKFNREWDEKRVLLEKHYQVDKALIRTLHSNLPVRLGKLKSLEVEFANRLEEHERMRNICLKDLKAKGLMAANNNELPLHGSEHDNQMGRSMDTENGAPDSPKTKKDRYEGGDKMTEMPLDLVGQRQLNRVGNASDGANIESTSSHTSEKLMGDATVSTMPAGEMPAQQNDLAGHADCVDASVPAVDSNKENAAGGTISPDDEVGHADCVDTRVPAVDSSKENAEGGIISPDDEAGHADCVETSVPAVDSNKQNAEGGAISLDDVVVHVDDSARMGVPAGDCNKEDAGDGTIGPDASHPVEDQNHSCGSSSSNSPSGAASQEKTPSAQPLVSPVSDHSAPTIPEVQNEPLQLLDNGIQNIVGQANPSSLVEAVVDNMQPIEAGQVDRINSEDLSLDEPLLSTNPSVGNLEEHPRVELDNSAPNPEAPAHTAEIQNQDASRTETNLFDVQRSENHDQYASRMPNQPSSDPLQAEIERLCEMKDSVVKFHEDSKLRLKSECAKEKAEMLAQINAKYEAKHQEEEAAFNSKTKELDAYLNRVAMNKILAEAFRSKCQDVTPSGHSGRQQVTQAGLMQQLHRFSMLPSMRRPTSVPLSSPGQSSRNHHNTPPPPLQRVNQPEALFSTTPTRPPPPTNPRPPSTVAPSPTPSRPPSTAPSPTPSRPPSTAPSPTPTRPPSTAPSPTPTRIPSTTITPSPTPTRPPSTNPTNPRPPSTIAPSPTPSRPPSTTPSPTPSRPPSNAASPTPTRPPSIAPSPTPTRIPSTTITPSPTPSRPPSTNPIIPSSTLTRPPTANPITPSPTATRPPTITPSPTPTRPPPTINPITPSTGNLRINTEIRAPPPHMRSISEFRAPAPHMRSSLSEIRAPAPHIRPFRPSSLSPHDFPSRMIPNQPPPPLQPPPPPPPPPESPPLPPPQPHAVTSSPWIPVMPTSQTARFTAPYILESDTPPPATTSPWIPVIPTSKTGLFSAPTKPESEPLPPPAESHSLQPPPPPPPPLATTSAPHIPAIPTSQTGLFGGGPPLEDLELLMDIDPCRHSNNIRLPPPDVDFFDLTEFGGEGGSVRTSSGHDIVCLSDDD